MKLTATLMLLKLSYAQIAQVGICPMKPTATLMLLKLSYAQIDQVGIFPNKEIATLRLLKLSYAQIMQVGKVTKNCDSGVSKDQLCADNKLLVFLGWLDVKKDCV